MAQIFWEQIRNELPDVGEFLTGSLSISGSLTSTGNTTIELDGNTDIFKVSVNGEEKVRVSTEGTLQLAPNTSTPTAIAGGLFYSSSNDYFFGFS